MIVDRVELWITEVTNDLASRDKILDMDLAVVLEWVQIRRVQSGAIK